MDNAEFAAALTAQTEQLERILAAGMERGQQQESILAAITKVNGFVREHGELLAAHRQWMDGHDKAQKIKDRDFHTLANRVWALAGLDAGLATVAILLRFVQL